MKVQTKPITYKPVAWAPQPGSQVKFLSCPATEVLYEGTRGPGKTDCLLVDYLADVGKGWGAEWRGILFRKSYPDLEDVIAKSHKLIPQFNPGAKFNTQKSFWTFPDGETLRFRQFQRPNDYWKYHGHAYPWIAWEEITTWENDQCLKSMMSCLRSTVKGIPLKIRATANPYGIGHNWVKARYKLPCKPGKMITTVITNSKLEDGTPEPTRLAIHGTIHENKVLLSADPEYINRVAAAARNPAERRAWVYGDWDIVAGGMFDDIWYEAKDKVVIKPFKIPPSWRIDRSFDWGSSRPFSVGWWAESDGTDVQLADGSYMSTVAGDLFRLAEWYGWNGTPNEGLRMTADQITQGIIERELEWGLHHRTEIGIADGSIFDEQNDNCVATDMEAEVRIDGKLYPGIQWEAADKSSGSRKQGWQRMRKMMKDAMSPEYGPRENPGLFVFDNCEQFLRTIPSLPRSDKDLDDVDSKAEDHIGDESRYRVRQEVRTMSTGRAEGI